MNKKTKYVIDNIVYFLYTFIFFNVQLLVVILYLRDPFQQFTLLGSSLLALKLGEFVNEKVHVFTELAWSIIGLFSMSILLIDHEYGKIIGFFLFGLSIMKIRDKFALNSTKKVKFTARALGFLFSPVGNFWIVLILGFVGTTLSLLRAKTTETKSVTLNKIKTDKNTLKNYIMFLHHCHYFAYAYSIPLVISIYSNIDFIYYGLIFYIGWIAYNAYERYVKPSWVLLAWGHFLATISLVLISVAENPYAIIFLWFMTGLGGGTVYMISHLIEDRSISTNKNLKISEGYGHVFGILLWFGVAHYSSLSHTFLVASFLSFIVVVLSVFLERKHKGQSFFEAGQ